MGAWYLDRVIANRRTAAAALAVAALVACGSPRPLVREVAPGVWTREIPLGSGLGANQGWIEFEDFVVVVDTNVLDLEGRMIDELHATTDKPIRFVVDTHHHGDHAHGNGRFAALGARIVAASAAREAFDKTRRDFAGQRLRRDHYPAYEEIDWVGPSIWFDSRLTFDDGSRRVELLYLGHAHSPGDALVWLPEEGVLFTGDVVANRHLSYLGDASVDRWIGILEELRRLPVRVVVPGHGPVGDAEAIVRQVAFLTDLRDAVRAAAGAGEEDPAAIAASLRLPGHPLWAKQPGWFRRLAVARVLGVASAGEGREGAD